MKKTFKRWRDRIAYRKTPSFLQVQPSECGAASLGIILAHYGKWVSLNELRRECGISRDGCSAADIKRAARKYGMHLRGQKLEPRHLRSLRLPAIIFWEFHHFCVLEGFLGSDYLINDPANGHRRVSEDEFDRAYTGIVLDFEPGSEFTREGRRSLIRENLWPWFKPHRTLLLIAAFCGLLAVIPALGIPLLLGEFVDRALGENRTDTTGIVGAASALALALFALTWLQQRVLRRMSLRVSVLQAERFVSRLLRLPNEYFVQRHAGDLAQRSELIDDVSDVGSTQLLSIVIELVLSIIFLAWMIHADLLLATFILSIGVANALILRVLSNIRLHENHRLRQERQKLIGVGTNALRKLASIHASGLENMVFSRWSGYQARELNARQRFAALGAVIAVLPALTQFAGAASVLYVGGLRIFSGDMTLGEVTAFFFIASRFLAPIGRFVDSLDRFTVLEADLQCIEDVMTAHENTPSSRQEEGRTSRPISTFQGKLKLTGHLEINGLTYGYRRYQRPLIADFHVAIQPGQRVAIVGPSGSGKSTLAMLVAGLFEPWHGAILFDGYPRTEIPHEVMTDSVAFVDQHVNLFSATIRENITMWNHTVPDHMVVAAAKDACIHEQIILRPENYDSLVLEGGSNFSGGQRQRLEIARALLYRPALLILDEATSDLDPAIERRIDDALRRRGCSCLVIAHRLSTIRDCDEILVMDQGRIVQRGRHEELMNDSQSDLYRRLIAGQ